MNLNAREPADPATRGDPPGGHAWHQHKQNRWPGRLVPARGPRALAEAAGPLLSLGVDNDETRAAAPRACPNEMAHPARAGRVTPEPPRCALNERDPDAELVARVGARDPGAVRTLVTHKLPRLLALATRMLGDRMEAEDVAQEAFMRIWKQAPQWRAGEAKFDTWLHRVALNLCYDRLRGRREEPVEAVPDEPDPDAAPDLSLAARARDERVRQALATLPVRQREALVLTYYQELSNIEAAALMDISVDALESLLARARRSLRAQLAGDGASKDTV